MNNLLQHPKFGQIRIQKQGENFLFCAADVCAVLELTNPTVAIQSLDEDERAKRNLGRQGDTWFITESGLYALIIRSNKPEARRFRKWITAEVLPALRKYGTYSTNPKMIDRAQKRLDEQANRQLLREVSEGLSDTDIKLVAKQCRIAEWHVNNVLSGRTQDAYMLALLYARATGNKLLRRSFYTQTGAEKLLHELQKK